MPGFLETVCSEPAYIRWLRYRAQAHAKRDRKRGNLMATRESYMQAIHAAVVTSAGRDVYTGEPLAWAQISTWDNAASRDGRRVYKKQFALLPTVDHVGDGTGPVDFVICGWRTNDCKNDLTHAELVEFCRAVLAHSAIGA